LRLGNGSFNSASTNKKVRAIQKVEEKKINIHTFMVLFFIWQKLNSWIFARAATFSLWQSF
jgi:hypothetical protein